MNSVSKRMVPSFTTVNRKGVPGSKSKNFATHQMSFLSRGSQKTSKLKRIIALVSIRIEVWTFMKTIKQNFERKYKPSYSQFKYK